MKFKVHGLLIVLFLLPHSLYSSDNNELKECLRVIYENVTLEERPFAMESIENALLLLEPIPKL